MLWVLGSPLRMSEYGFAKVFLALAGKFFSTILKKIF